ncbi:MAG: GLUG motif-containing protein [bacterium]
MKRLFKILSAFVLCFTVISLTACDTGATPTIKDIKTSAIREKVTVDFVIWDEDALLTELTLTISGEVNGESYSKTERVTITGGEFATEEDVTDEIEIDDFIGESESVAFTGLEIGEAYVVTFTGTYNDRARKMHTTSKLITSGEGGSKEAAHEIRTFEDLNDIVRNDPDGYFELMNDIDCEGKELSPLFSSSSTKQFLGDFDGQGNAITNFKQDTYDQYLGLFGYIADGGEVYDLDISDSTINSLRYTNLYIGVVAGRNSGTISNVTVTDCTITTSGPDDGDQYIGGLVGYNKAGIIADCDVTDTTLDLNVPSYARIGGLVGASEAQDALETSITNSNVNNVLVDVQISNTPGYSVNDSDFKIEMAIGGFIGYNAGNIASSTAVNSKVYIYVDQTQTDKDLNTSETVEVVNMQRHALIEEMNLSVGGFAGTNFSGRITGSSTDAAVTIDVPYLDILRIGGFIGWNSYMSVVSNASFSSATYSVIVGEDTNLTSVSDDSTIGNKFGINNAYQTISFDSIGTITYNISVRNSSKNTEGEYEYTFDTTPAYSKNNK